jgi:aspartate aminotransferase-like enzyme
MSPVLTTAFCPPGLSAVQIVKYLETEHHIKITTGFAAMRDKVIRIGHMGGALAEADIDALLAALRQFLAERERQPAE